MKRSPSIQAQQRGIATLAITLILLFLVTMVTLYTAQTSLTEQRISANQYRADQAFSAANAALDFAIAHVQSGGPDQFGAGGPGTTPDDAPDSGTVSIEYPNGFTQNASWNLNRIDLPITITAQGFSDDRSSQRTLSVLIGNVDGTGDGPDQPLIARGNVAVTGSMVMVNKYKDTVAWMGGTSAIGTTSSSATTWIADPGDPPITDPADPNYDQAALLGTGPGDTPIKDNAIPVSGKEAGKGIDILDGDPTLANLIPTRNNLLPRPAGPAPTNKSDYFWYNFFEESPYWYSARALEVDQYKDSGTNANALNEILATTGTSGLIWIEGDLDLTNTNDIVGSADEPVVLIVNGTLTTAGGQIWGLVYVVDNWVNTGNTDIFGAIIVEGTVSGNGGGYLVYFPEVLGSPGEGLDGERAVVLGTWRDWQ